MGDVSLEDCLPDTQGAAGSSISADNSSNAWGHLFSQQDGFCSVDLVKQKYTFGRLSKCDVVYQDKGIDPSLLSTLSKEHFVIERDDTTKTVRLTDASSNGTYINEILVGQKETSVLEPNDQISLAFPAKKVYMFVATGMIPNGTEMPREVTDIYHVSRKLGSGAYGQVCLVFDKSTKARYALKTVSKLRAEIEHPGLINEAKLLTELHHPCIIEVVTTIDSITSLHIVLELMEGGNLLSRMQKVKRFSEAEAKFINYQIALAVNYLHERDISHRDLKLENILLDADKEFPFIKLADFGLSRKFGKSMMKTYCGTPLYAAPEILISKGHKNYSKEVDIWSLGVIAYISLCGEHPFKKTEKTSLEEEIIRGCYFFSKPAWENVSVQAIEIVKLMLNIKPDERLNVTQVLAHKWLMDDVMRKKVHAALRIPFKRTSASNENAVPNRRKK